jgi:hypothetical protein
MWRNFMRFSEITETILSEMIIRHQTERGDMLVAFKDSIWIFDQDEYDHNENAIQDKIEKIAGPMPTYASNISDERPDMVVGSYNDIDNTLTIEGSDTKQHPVTSKLIQKVVKQLNIENVEYASLSGDIDSSYSPNEIKGKLPEYGYHGTSLRRLRGILKTGLAAQNMGNWGNIHTKGAIFFAVSDGVPRFHANRTARKDNDIPVIIKFKIPDPSQIFADYDVASELYGSWSQHAPKEYQNSATMPARDNSITKHHKRPQNLWKDMGIFGYKGRISPSMFVEFYTTSMAPSEYPEEDGYVVMSRDEMNDYMKAYVYVADNYGDVQDYVTEEWPHYSSEEIIAELEPEEDEEDL